MEGTIGGRPINEVLLKLKEDIPGVIKMTTERESNPYLDSTILRNYFDEHVPVSNYDFNLSDMQFIQLNGRACFVCTGTIILYDDNRHKIVEKSYVGSNKCIISKQSGAPIDLAMDAKNAAVAAKKGCISQFGCGNRQLEEAKAKNKALRNNRENTVEGVYEEQMVTEAEQKSQENQRPKFGTDNYLLVYHQAKQIKDFPKMMLVPVICREYQNYETTLVIWKNKCSDIAAVRNRIETGMEFTCDGRFEPYSNQTRIVFEKLSGRKP